MQSIIEFEFKQREKLNRTMRHIAAYALLVLGGKKAPTAAEVEKVVKDAGSEADKEKCAALVEAFKGK